MRESLLMEPLHPQILLITANSPDHSQGHNGRGSRTPPIHGTRTFRPGCQIMQACHSPSTSDRTHSRHQLEQDPHFPILPLTDRMHSPPLRRRTYRTFFATPTGNLTRARSSTLDHSPHYC